MNKISLLIGSAIAAAVIGTGEARASDPICYMDMGNGVVDLSHLCGGEASSSGGGAIIQSSQGDEGRFLDSYKKLNSDSLYSDSQVITDGYEYCELATQMNQRQLSAWRIEQQIGSAQQQTRIQNHWVAISVAGLSYLCP
ncbi:MAG: hypothetical protein AAF773_00790 [Cyanobacteria bacterium P01_D01_bin.115]